MENGLSRVVCPKCGESYSVYKNDEVYDPEYCPGCGYKIKELIVPSDGSRIIAKVEKNEN